MAGPVGGAKPFDRDAFEKSAAAKTSGLGTLTGTVASHSRDTPEVAAAKALERDRRIAAASRMTPDELASGKSANAILADRIAAKAAAASPAGTVPAKVADVATPVVVPAKAAAPAAPLMAAAPAPIAEKDATSGDDIATLTARAQGAKIMKLQTEVSALVIKLSEKDNEIAQLKEQNKELMRDFAELRLQVLTMKEEFLAYNRNLMGDVAAIKVRVGLGVEVPKSSVGPAGTPAAAAVPAVGVAVRPLALNESRWQGPGSAS